MTNNERCPKCGAKMKIVAYSSGSATGQEYKERWICPICRFTK